VPVGMKVVMTDRTPGQGVDRGSGGLTLACCDALAAGGPQAIAPRTPMNVAAAGYVLAIGLAWVAVSRPARENHARQVA
jgi:hypothetical protein